MPSPVGTKADAAEAKPRLEESRPALYYLKDKSGNLQPVPGFSLEEFEELYKLKYRLASQDERPRHSLQRMSIQAQANAEQAELTVQFVLQIRDESWVRVPLRFDSALLREPPQYKGPGEHFLHFEADGEGYVSWFRGQSDQLHEVTLKFLVPLTVVGDETRLRFNAPRATSSEMKLRVSTPNATAKISERATLQQIASAGAVGTDFTVLGLGGDFEIAWTRNDAAGRTTPPVLEVSTAALARIDPYGVHTEATLNVRSHTVPFDTLRISLPPGAELVPGAATGYTVAQVAGATPQQQMAEVRLAKKTAGPVEIRLNTRRPPIPVSTEEWSELAGFDVLRAARQSGVIAVAAMPEVQVLWGPNRGVRQTEQVPETLRREDIAAAFEYFSQPCSLTMRLLPKKTRIHVEPEYRLSIEADQSKLDARLRYAIRGVKVYTLRVAMPGWEVDDVGPEQSIAIDGISMGDDSLLTVPLLQPISGSFELRIRAHRVVARDATTLDIAIPRPQADSFGPAVLAVSPADNVELTPASAAMKGLTRESMPPQWKLPERQQPPLFYRGDGAQAVFAAEFRTHTRQLRYGVASTIDFEQPGGEAEQAINWTIAYEPADALTLLVPRSLAHSDSLQILFQGKPLVPVALPEGEEAAYDAPVRMQINLPAPCIGSCELSIRYPLGIPTDVLLGGESVSVPLIMPAEGTQTVNRLSVRTTPGTTAVPDRGVWTAVEKGLPNTPRPRLLELTSTDRPTRFDLTLRRKAAKDKVALVADRAWLQTWMTHSSRQDRAVYRFTSDRKEIEVVLPSGVALGQASASLDGNRLNVTPNSAGRISIPLADDGVSRQYVLELQYHFPNQRPRPGAMSVELPKLGPGAWVRRTYWQLVLPQDEHLVAAPNGLVGEFAWDWQRYYLGRSPLLEQADLENWSGAPHRLALPVGTNRYLFSSMGPLETCQLRTAERATIVFLASALALALGLLLVYLPAARHPAGLATASAALCGLTLTEPAAALLFLQAAFLGVVLALLAGMLHRWTARPALPEQSSVVVRTSAGSRRADALVLTPAPEVSTQTAPAVATQPDPNP